MEIELTMDRKEAFDLLNVNDAHLRLDAARSMRHHAKPDDLSTLRAKLRTESVPWIRAALQQAIEGLEVENPSHAEDVAADTVSDEDERQRFYLDAVQTTTYRLVHETRQIVGTVAYWAGQETPNFQESKTAKQIDRLRECLSALEKMQDASRRPEMVDLDLHRLIEDELSTLGSFAAGVQLIGQRPLLVVGDHGLLQLILRNALLNARDAVLDDDVNIHVNWGETDVDYWVAVFDRGEGLPTDVDALFDFGSTTRHGHIGAGLAIASQAALTMGGGIDLSSQSDGSTKLEVRWAKRVRSVEAPSN